MDLRKKVVALFVLLTVLIMQVSASGDMSGSDQNSGGPMGDETGSTIIIETSGEYSGGYSGGYYPGTPSGYTSGYRSPASGGVTLGYNSPMAGTTLSGNNPSPDAITKDIVSGVDKLSQDLKEKEEAYNSGAISLSDYANYLRNVDGNVRTIKVKMDYLQWLVDIVTPQEIIINGGGPKQAIPVTGHEG